MIRRPERCRTADFFIKDNALLFSYAEPLKNPGRQILPQGKFSKYTPKIPKKIISLNLLLSERLTEIN